MLQYADLVISTSSKMRAHAVGLRMPGFLRVEVCKKDPSGRCYAIYTQELEIILPGGVEPDWHAFNRDLNHEIWTHALVTTAKRCGNADPEVTSQLLEAEVCDQGITMVPLGEPDTVLIICFSGASSGDWNDGMVKAAVETAKEDFPVYF